MSETETEPRDDAEAIVPTSNFVYYSFGGDEIPLKYVQKPLSFFGKIELFGLLGQTVDKALSGGLTVADVLDEIPENGADNSEDFIRTIAKLVTYAPDFLLDLYVIALGVPKGDRQYVKTVFELQEDEGGLSDDQGIQILETFVDQNWKLLVDFFTERIVPMFNKMTTQVQKSASSKPSKTTRTVTPKQ